MAAPPTQISRPQPRAHAVGVAGPYATDVAYTDRDTKAVYIARKYAPILTGRVLDVGCDAARLRGLVARPDAYVGVDMREDADVVLNLDRQDLPFADASFDTVVCTDVLEHLERCHAVFDELCRVSRGRVVASLPNPVGNLVQNLFEGRCGRIKYYGLPVDPPADRHRWFFGFEDAERFFTERGGRVGFEIEQLDVESMTGPYWLVGRETPRDVLDHANVKAGTIWCVLKRRGDA